jgi:hypothetical protein
LFIPSKSCCGTKPFPRAMQFLVMQRTNNWWKEALQILGKSQKTV